MQSIIVPAWDGYTLLATGNGERLEQLGPYTVRRPDANVIWKTSPLPAADLRFTGQGASPWQGESGLFSGWNFTWQDLVLKIKPTTHRHLGVFPEQQANWEWIQKVVKDAKRPLRVLNMFAYTGASTIVASQAGAHVTHVDASKGTVYWASENAMLSGLKKDSVRWIVDDARKFLKREARRGSVYDLILLDPPVFGRGSKGEVWRLEEDLPELLQLCSQVLSPNPAGFLLNFYATDLYPLSVERVVQEILGSQIQNLQLHSLSLREKDSDLLLQTGFCVRG